MPDHAHAIFRITDGSALGDILHSVKSFSAKGVNSLLGRQGPLWLDENFDHIIRHEAEWHEKRGYILQNPVTKGLVARPEEYKWLYCRGHRQDACAAVEFEIFEPSSEKDVSPGTVTRAKATCPCCAMVLPPERVRAQLPAQRGGVDVIFGERLSGTGFQPVRSGGARLPAVVTLKDGQEGRQSRLPTARDYEAVRKASQRLEKVAAEKLPNGLSPVPDEPLPPIGTLGFRVQRYGVLGWGGLFEARQKPALATLLRQIAATASDLPAAKEIASLALSRFADICNALCRWENRKTQVRNLFTRRAIPILCKLRVASRDCPSLAIGDITAARVRR